VHCELVSQILLRALAVAPKVGWGKELVPAIGTTRHSGNFAVVPQDDEAALWHDEDSVPHSQKMRHRAPGRREEAVAKAGGAKLQRSLLSAVPNGPGTYWLYSECLDLT
jgi:hypothetical protein